MTGPGSPARVERLWGVILPRWLQPWAPGAAEAVADGTWAAAWPWVAVVAPVAGLVGGALLARSDSVQSVGAYTASLGFLAVMVVLAILDGAAGVAAMAAFIVLDVVTAWDGSFRGAFRDLPWIVQAVRLYGSLLVGYLLLSMLVVRVTLLARRILDGAPLDRVIRSRAEPAARAALYGVACGTLVWIWCQAMIVLVRPAFTWLLDNPPTPAVQIVQTQWPVLVILAVVAGVARVLLEDVVAARSPRRDVVERLNAERADDVGRPQALPAPWHVTARAVTATLLLAGAFSVAADAAVVLVVTAALAAWERGVLGRPAAVWARLVIRVPAAARLAVAIALGYWLAGLVVARLWSTGTFRPVLFGGLAAMVVFTLLFPHVTGPVGEAGGRARA